MKKAFRINIYRTIQKSLGRYMAIFAIIALGVGFFAGLKTTKPSMMKTAREYVKEEALYDFRLLSTWGFEEKEVQSLSELKDAADAEGAVSEDFIYVNDQGEESVLKAHSITNRVNQLRLTQGRMPESPNECVLDAYYFGESMIGKKITISEKNSQETKDSFSYETYTVTGLVRSPLYMNLERGTTTLGSGKLSGFVFMPLDGFSYEYFEEVYVSCKDKPEGFTDEYNEYIEDRTEAVEDDVTALIKERYNSEIADAQKEIEDGEQELHDKVAEAEAELADAKAELTDGEAQLADGKQELLDSEQMLADSERELADGEKALEEGQAQYEEGLAEYESGRVQYVSGLAEYESGYSEYESGLTALEENRELYEGARADLNGRINPGGDLLTKGQITGGYLAGSGQFEPLSWSEYLMGLFESGQITPDTLQGLLLTADTTEASPAYQATAALITEYQTVAVFEENQQKLSGAKAQLDTVKSQLDAVKAQLDEAKMQLDESSIQLEENRRKLADGRKQLADGKQELAGATVEITKSEQELSDGWKEYEDGKEKLARETKDAKEELADAGEKLADIEEPKVYVLGA